MTTSASKNAAEVAAPTAYQTPSESLPVYTNFLARALPLADLGLEVFPIDGKGKEPLALGFLNKRGKPARLKTSTNATSDAAVIVAKWGDAEHEGCNVGVFFRTSNWGADIDSLSECEKILGVPLDIQGARVNTSTPDKLHLYFDGALPDWFWTRGVSYQKNGEKRELFSIRYDGRYLVGPGSVHPSGAVYQWANGRPDSLPASNENLLRQLQAIAEKQGETRPTMEAMGNALLPDRYEARVEKLRENFERMGLPSYEECTSRSHGGVEFIFDECPLESHAEGDNSGMIALRPDGVICWGCFHSHGSLIWSEVKPQLEEIYGSKFDYGDAFKSGTVTFGSGTAAPTQSKAKLRLLSPAQLRIREVESGATEQLVEGLLPRHGVSVAIGDSNIGKSPLMVQLAVCVAAGVPFLGRTVRQGRAILLDYENTGLLADMIAQTTKAVGADPAVVEANLSIVDRDALPSFDGVIEGARNAALIVVDSFRFLTEGHDSKGEIILPIMRALGAEKNCWVLVHHIRKGDQDNQREKLDSADSLMQWLENAAGHRAIINQSTNRWAIDDRTNRSEMVIRVSAKGRAEGAPIHLNRIYAGPEPIGYEVAKGALLLTSDQQTLFARAAGQTLSWEGILALAEGKKSRASRFLAACRAYGVVIGAEGGHKFASLDGQGLAGF